MTIPVLDKIELVSLIVVVGMLLLAAQRYFANKRLANKRRNSDQSWRWGFGECELYGISDAFKGINPVRIGFHQTTHSYFVY
jgi:hypothetical protein